MADTKIQCFDISAGYENIEEEALSVLMKVRTDWKREDIEIKNFTEGLINHMFRFSLKSDEEKNDAVVVRIFGRMQIEGQADIYMGTDEQVMSMQIAHAVGIAEPVYAIFKNGIVYKYAPGRTLTAEDARDPEIIRLMCNALARFHCADLKNIPAYKLNGELSHMEPKENQQLLGYIDKIPEMLPDDLKDKDKDSKMKEALPPKEKLAEEVQKAWKWIHDNIEFEFCHSDFHIKNLVYNPTTKKLTVLDYELVGLAAKGYDLARTPGLSPMWKDIGFCDKNVIFKDEEMLEYARIYLEEKYKIMNKNPKDVKEEEIQELYWQIRMCWAFSDLLNSIGMLIAGVREIKTSKEIDMDYLSISIRFYKLYEERRDFFFNSERPAGYF